MEAEAKMELIKVTAKPYDFEGNNGKQLKGTSYKATLISPQGNIFVMKTDESVFKDVGDDARKSGTAVIKITENEVDKKVVLFLQQFNYE